jgi:7,8-dihydropterin-6-yl-methyl-4-(beta-D-ribofuranosyl)aminobenzene 5'-phosphate synthase
MRKAGAWIIIIFITCLDLSLNTTVVWGSVSSVDQENMGEQYTMHAELKNISHAKNKDLSITVIYDNNLYKVGLETGWGFSCLIRGTEKAVLFDTGGDGSKLLANMKKLGISPREIDMVVLSHIHGDHVGGLTRFLEKNPNVTVFVLKSFQGDFKRDIRHCGAQVVEVQKSMNICEDMYSTGELGTVIKEQSLIVKTDRGLIVITGCAHPGIVKVVKKTKGLFKDTVLFVMGGYHLGSKNRRELESIISDLKDLGVRYVGPCHCTGEKARELFKKAYREKYIPVGVGKIIDTRSLQ